MIDFSNVALMTKRVVGILPGSPPAVVKSAILKVPVCTLDYFPPELLRQYFDKSCNLYELT
jgi:hypothetical protein